MEKYSDKNLLESNMIRLLYDPNYLGDLKYFIKRRLGACEVDEEIEDRRKADFSLPDYDNTFYLGMWGFKENFGRYMGISPYNLDFKRYEKEILYYLESTYPYSLMPHGVIQTGDFEKAILYYAKHKLKASEEQLDKVVPMLKEIPMTYGIRDYFCTTEFGNCNITFSDVSGSTVDLYGKKNLYDTLSALDDKGVSNFVNLYGVYDGLNNPSQIMSFQNPYCYIDTKGRTFVDEGNHRILTGLALQRVDELITGKSNKEVPFTVGYSKSLRR